MRRLIHSACMIWTFFYIILIVLFIDTNVMGSLSAGWNLVNNNPAIGVRGAHCLVFVDVGADRGLYWMGGTSTGSNYLRDIWRSTTEPYSDFGASAYVATATWTGRVQMRCVVLRTTPRAIVLTGGYAGGTTAYNEVWTSTNGGTSWAPTSASAPWTARDLHGFVADPLTLHLYLFGGLARSPTNIFLSDVWKSTDQGATWTQLTGSVVWGARAGMATTWYQDRIWLFGGQNSAAGGPYQDVWSSIDGLVWTCLSSCRGSTSNYGGIVPWTRYHVAMWAINSTQSLYIAGGTLTSSGPEASDTYVSRDGGLNWCPITVPAAPIWSGRQLMAYTVVNENQLYMTGGYCATACAAYLKDVYALVEPVSCSTPSANTATSYQWRLTPDAPWSPRQGAAAAVLGTTIYLMGGISSFSSNSPLADMWKSDDGAQSWLLVTATASWTARHSHGATATATTVYMVAGLADSGSTILADVWSWTSGGGWILVSSSAAFGTRYGASFVSDGSGNLYVVGGYSGSAALRDCWKSTNGGGAWASQSPINAGSVGTYYQQSLWYNSKIWYLGGHTASATFNNVVWDSTTGTGASWVDGGAGATPGFAVRGGYCVGQTPAHGVVLIGGAGASSAIYSDMWTTTTPATGASWTVQPNHPLPRHAKRAYAACVTLGNAIVMMGGFDGTTSHNSTYVFSVNDCASWPCANGGTCLDQYAGFLCLCLAGYSGSRCETEIDECASQPCRNGATCLDRLNFFQCQCAAGFSGVTCQTETDECQSSPCLHGNCIDQVNGYLCSCQAGWSGPLCQTEINECTSSPCHAPGSATCIDQLNGYVCTCHPGYSGLQCYTDINECSSQPCDPVGGTCVDLVNGYRCQCALGFSGDRCETDINECSSQPCRPGTGTCVDAMNGYACQCLVGYSGIACQTEIDECVSAPCLYGGVCIDLVNSYYCQCPPGFSGVQCETDIDECTSQPCFRGSCIDGSSRFDCNCPPGVSGIYCETDIDECASQPCLFGVCLDGSNRYDCLCPAGFVGTYCETQLNECASQPCVSGTCIDHPNAFECQCLAGFAGMYCETEINECQSQPCLHGTCIDAVDRYTCLCDVGFSGHRCETEINECISNPCLSGGTCVDHVNLYVCLCPSGCEGTHCETEIRECASTPCQHGASCVDQINGYRCECEAGYSGRWCETEVDECSSLPCQAPAVCIDTLNQYICQCTPGYSGRHCETDIDECASTPCQHSAVCSDQIDGYLCLCPAGYTGTHCETDVDECASSPCQSGGSCSDQINGYQCHCLSSHSGIHCETDMDACASTPCWNGLCVDLMDGYRCQCMPGYEGTHCETDTDECASQPCFHGTCVDQMNGYACQCTSGYRGLHCETDTDECISQPCALMATCVDQVDGYICQCPPGYNGLQCQSDVDECASQPCMNGGSCVNDGDCICSPGWSGKQCQTNMNECASHPCLNGGTCVDETNHYQCLCVVGTQGEHCETDLDECASLPCLNGATCVDQSNGYRCQCRSGFAGADCATNVNECASFPCENGATCVDYVNGYTCVCRPGTSGPRCQVDVDECLSSPCHHGSLCVDELNGYSCLCLPGFTGVHCETDINECESSPCVSNHGFCRDGRNRYDCICLAGYSGVYCEQNMDECLSLPCLYGGTCIDRINGYECQCLPSFSGPLCQLFDSLTLACQQLHCQHDAECMAVNGSTTQVGCQCTHGWIGPQCNDRLPQLVRSLPDNLPTNAGELNLLVTIIGSDFQSDMQFAMDGHASGQVTYVSENQAQGPAPSWTKTGYRAVSLSWRRFDFNQTKRLVYYYDPQSAMQQCLEPGRWFDRHSGECLDCPHGARCPGGDRLWPLYGYWSPDETTAPIACSWAGACPGAMSEDPEYPTQYLETGARDTTLCAWRQGYTGEYCSQCLAAFYKDNLLCFSCGSPDQQQTDLLVRVAVALIIYGLMGFAIATLRHDQLRWFVSGLLAFQQVIVLLRLASDQLTSSSSSASSWISTIVHALALTNFEIAYFKPGCSVPTFSFVELFLATVILTGFAALIFFVAALTRRHLILHNHTSLRRVSNPQSQHPHAHHLSVRIAHAMVILGTVVYLQIALRAFEGLICTSQGVLQVELSTRCYVDSHLGVFIVICLILVGYLVGFPIWCGYIGWQHFRPGKHLLTTGYVRAMEQYAFLFRDVYPRWYWFRLSNFALNFIVALTSSVVRDLPTRVWIAVGMLSIQSWIAMLILPFRQWRSNLTTIAVGIGVQIAGLLFFAWPFFSSSSLDTTHLLESWSWWSCVVFLMISFGLLIGRRIKRPRDRCCVNSMDLVDHELVPRSNSIGGVIAAVPYLAPQTPAAARTRRNERNDRDDSPGSAQPLFVRVATKSPPLPHSMRDQDPESMELDDMGEVPDTHVLSADGLLSAEPERLLQLGQSSPRASSMSGGESSPPLRPMSATQVAKTTKTAAVVMRQHTESTSSYQKTDHALTARVATLRPSQLRLGGDWAAASSFTPTASAASVPRVSTFHLARDPSTTYSSPGHSGPEPDDVSEEDTIRLAAPSLLSPPAPLPQPQPPTPLQTQTLRAKTNTFTWTRPPPPS